MTKYKGKKLYKVLEVMKEFSTGTIHHVSPVARVRYDHALPKGDQPGTWLEVDKEDIIMCAWGYHVTTDPRSWRSIDSLVFEAEIEGVLETAWGEPQVNTDGNGYKLCAARMRLLREVPWDSVR